MEQSEIDKKPSGGPIIQNLSPQQQFTFLERYNISPILFVFISLVVLFGTYQIVGSLIVLLVFGAKITPQNVNDVRWLTMLGQVVFLFFPTLLLTRLVTFKLKEFLKLKRPKLTQSILVIIGILSLQQILQVYMVFQDKIPLPESIQSYVEQIKHGMEEAYKLLAGSSNLNEMLFVILVVAFVPAFAEEVLFRGLVQGGLSKRLSIKKSVIITGIVFGAFHLNPFSFIPLSALGIYLGFMTAKSGSIYTSITAHFFNNLIAILALRFGLGDNDLITGDAANMPLEELAIIFIASSVVFVLSIYYFIRVSEKNVNLNKEE
jgi:uncharacterized protein